MRVVQKKKWRKGNKGFCKNKQDRSPARQVVKKAEAPLKWAVNYTEQFEIWWETLTEAEQIDVAAIVGLLEERGATLPFPYSSSIEGSNYSHMRELRIQHAGRPYRVLYAFDRTRTAILLVGGDKTGDKRWYKTHIPVADQEYSKHLESLEKEGS